MPPPGYPSSEYSPAVARPTQEPKQAESGQKPKKTWGDAALWAIAGLAIILLIALIAVVIMLARELDDQKKTGECQAVNSFQP